MSYTHFTLSERKYLQELLVEGPSMRKIAEILDRSPSTISREIQRNCAQWKPHKKPDNPYWYNHWRARISTPCGGEIIGALPLARIGYLELHRRAFAFILVARGDLQPLGSGAPGHKKA